MHMQLTDAGLSITDPKKRERLPSRYGGRELRSAESVKLPLKLALPKKRPRAGREPSLKSFVRVDPDLAPGGTETPGPDRESPIAPGGAGRE